MSPARSMGRVLVVAGSDSGGGAGIEADIKTISYFGAYAATAITALTAQNTTGVQDIQEIPAAFVGQCMRAVLGDIGADCIKTGMLSNSDIINEVAAVIGEMAAEIPLVIDPVMQATEGNELLGREAAKTLKSTLVPLATLITPNLPEAEFLADIAIENPEDMLRAARIIRGLGARAVLVTGGHLPGDEIVDVLVYQDGEQRFARSRIQSNNTHGTGCTLASAIAAQISQGAEMGAAIQKAQDYVRAAIEAAPGFGDGIGPIGHNLLPQK